MTLSTRRRIAVYALVLLAFALRTYRIDAVPLRGDEAFSMLNWTGPLKLVLRDIAPIDPQPPLAFAGLSAWVRLTGSSALAARYYSTLWSVLSIAPLYQVAKRLPDKRVGLLAALLWAVSPFQIWHAQDIRAYTLWPAFSLLATWLLLLSLESGRRRHRAAYVIAAALGAYSFYTEGFILVFHNLYALWYLRRNRQSLWPWIGAQFAIALLLAPWYLQAPRLAASGYSGTGPRLVGLTQLIQAIPNVITTLVYGFTLPDTPIWQTALTAFALISVAAGIVLITARRLRHRYFLAGYAIVPLTLLLILSTIGGFYRPRYLNGAAPAYIIAFAAVVGWLLHSQRSTTKWGAVLLLSAMLGVNAFALTNYFINPKYVKAPNWPPVTDTLTANARSTDVIIRNASDPAFDYYYKGDANRATIPARPHPPLSESIEQLESTISAAPRIWFVPTDHLFWDPDYHAATYLQDNLQLLADYEFGRFHLQRWAPWSVAEEELIYKTYWQIGELANLVGFDTIPLLDSDEMLHAAPGDTITLIVFWQPSGVSYGPLTVFTHLIGPPAPDGNALWAGHDHLPQYGRVSTTNWTDEGLLRDSYNITIPPDAPSAEFTINVGMYNAASGERLPVSHPTQQAQNDSIPLVKVRIEK